MVVGVVGAAGPPREERPGPAVAFAEEARGGLLAEGLGGGEVGDGGGEVAEEERGGGVDFGAGCVG